MKFKQEGEEEMASKLKACGLAMIPVLAVSSVTASAAQAATHHVTVGTAPAIVTAKATVNPVFKITGGEHEVECEATTYEGTLSEATNTEITVTGTYSGCQIEAPFGPTATVHVNHCAYVLGGDTDVNGDAALEVECAPENETTVTYELFGSKCVLHMTPGSYRGVHYTQNGSKIKIQVTVSGIKYHETGSGFCPANDTGEDGTINGTMEAEGFKDTGTAQTETAKTTPTFSEGAAQKLTLNENVT
jgi:hypothetical protein